MKTLRRVLVPLAILPFKNITYAQKKDSIPLKVRAFFADKIPQARNFNLEYTLVSPSSFSSQLQGKDMPDNKVKSFQQVKADANIYFIKNRSWLLSTALSYRYTSIRNENPVIPGIETDENFHYHSEAINLTYFSKLLKKTAIYSASISTDGSDQHFERIRGLVTASLILKATPKIKMTLGLAGIIDPSTQIPVLPIFTYENRFNNGWVLDVLLPKKVLVRKDISSNGRVSLGTEMDNTSFYTYRNNNTYEFRQVAINSGVIYEHNLGGNFIGTFKTGLRANINSRAFNKQESFNDYIWKGTYKPSFYFNAGISYNPFERRRSK
ncbi:DUF6268 family outer membrane beta-barrel protein [Chryseobacterium viscerum]|uniref:DUF6268 family outer membrane beta-barrel protein n=1 Tax=Chryseobacterium viscerum TaxID=1037377 RepID=UPI0022235054|nr:DUF6268 family outer membrane beta-barrel protein [Chryseobacterium viscerum]MCW1961640.1 DUF6268 family outer membrane beta-barrel protein [Chryseobacterium viscerum]